MLQTLGKLFRADVLSHWSTVDVDGHAVDLYLPDPSNLAGCVLYLHGHGEIGLTENRVWTQLLYDHRLAAVCPHGGRSWWMDRGCHDFDDRISPMDWLRTQLMPFVERRIGLTSPQVALLGTSMGGQGVLQLAYRHAREFPVVAAISPAPLSKFTTVSNRSATSEPKSTTESLRTAKPAVILLESRHAVAR